ncbi:MAG: hypothetical protein CMP94_00520 [Gammaproteobacteria bacterium]|nr:hypothetical protein [Gammaproteobacteria bacterium]
MTRFDALARLSRWVAVWAIGFPLYSVENFGYGRATVFFRTMTQNTTRRNIIQIDVTDQICTTAVQYIRAQ